MEGTVNKFEITIKYNIICDVLKYISSTLKFEPKITIKIDNDLVRLYLDESTKIAKLYQRALNFEKNPFINS